LETRRASSASWSRDKLSDLIPYRGKRFQEHLVRLFDVAG
jgi:hypothetical protein